MTNISCICDLNISDKQIKYDGCSVYMCGFRDYSVDKYIQKVTENGISFMEKRLSDGRGMRLNMDSTFKGFID